MFGNRNLNYVCEKHKYSRKGYGLCPICREPLESLGDKWRIGHQGQFNKKERKTKKFAGQKRKESQREFNLRAKALSVLIKKNLLKKTLKLEPLIIPPEDSNYGC